MHVYYTINNRRVKFDLSNDGVLTATRSYSDKIRAGKQYTVEDINCMAKPKQVLSIKDRMNLGFGFTESSRSFGVVRVSPKGEFFAVMHAKNFKHLQRLLSDTNIYPLTPAEMSRYYFHHNMQRWSIDIWSVVGAKTFSEYQDAIRMSRPDIASNIKGNSRARIRFDKNSGKFDYSGHEYETYDQAVEAHNRSLDNATSKKALVIKDHSLEIIQIIVDHGVLYHRDLSAQGLDRYQEIYTPVHIPKDDDFSRFVNFKARVDDYRDQQTKKRTTFFESIVKSNRPTVEEVCISIRRREYMDCINSSFAPYHSLRMGDH